MSSLEQAARAALEAMENHVPKMTYAVARAATDLRAALAERDDKKPKACIDCGCRVGMAGTRCYACAQKLRDAATTDPAPQDAEPVAWMCPDNPDRATAFYWSGKGGHCPKCNKALVPLYTRPIAIKSEDKNEARFDTREYWKERCECAEEANDNMQRRVAKEDASLNSRPSDEPDIAKARNIAREYAWSYTSVKSEDLYWALHVALNRLDSDYEPVAWHCDLHSDDPELYEEEKHKCVNSEDDARIYADEGYAVTPLYARPQREVSDERLLMLWQGVNDPALLRPQIGERKILEFAKNVLREAMG